MIDRHAQTLPCKWLPSPQRLHVTNINGFIPTSPNHATIINGFISTSVSPAITKLGRIADWHALTLPCSLATTRLVFNAVIRSHFNYCPLIWMFDSRRSNNLINRIHETFLRTVYNDTNSTFQELLQRSRSVSIHLKNIQTLTELQRKCSK